ncbi:myo-inositol-1-phosphate synthase [Stackebrandtia endophytica]|uniref:Myo-inositol-1-phosphate synthase n=1 Tax=Stackebrandtia endophytica TaxID=1496996 RepID=A0A543B2B2_9ACTN|nr:inositol-3-phosphate synthase [Stackebrandtia endophytica]TQL78972.1 myo-inositol-1-phosphate synthase [Stackebrandtia endophytica]
MAIKVGIVGVGNCASSLVQGVEYYRDRVDSIGLANPVCAGYPLSTVEFSSAFDIDSTKVGRDLSQAIWLGPNNSRKFAEVPHLGVEVVDGIQADSLTDVAADHIDAIGRADVTAIAHHLKTTETTIVVNFLPVGAQEATERYAEAALAAGCGFINCMPSRLARDPDWARRFDHAGLPLMGDDLTSQFGSTMIHRALVTALADNGVRLRNTFQLNSGGNMDFVAMQDRTRMRTKQESKADGAYRNASAVAGYVGAEYVPFLADTKVAYIRLEADGFGGTPLDIELRMNVEDSPSAAGNVLDAVRYMARAAAEGRGGVLTTESELLMKAPGAR